jgi:predicted metalloendopeptidase
VHPIRLAVRALGAAALTALVATSLPTVVARAAAAPSSAASIDPANLDPTCKACDDFYRFATGGWNKAHPIPPGHASWGAFNELAEHNRDVLHGILEDVSKATNAPAGSDEQRLGAFYRSCMDEAAIERTGTAPIAPLLAKVADVNDPSSLVAAVASLEQSGVDGGLDFRSAADTKDSSKQIAAIGIGGLGLPDRDYYLKPERVKVLDAYRGYVATQLENLGDDAATAKSEADGVVALESALAKDSPSLVDRRDAQKTYHPTKIADLASLAPHVPWKSFFASYGPPSFGIVDVSWPAFLSAYDAQLGATPLTTWKNYLRFRIVDAYGSALPKRFADASFAFHSGVLFGVKEQLPRWQRCTSATDASLRDILGKAYVEKAFPPAAKARAKAMVDNLQAVLRTDIAQLDWMSAPTKAKAIEKLDAFTKKIGYPERWEDLSALTVSDQPYALNVQAVRKFQLARSIKRIGTATDRSRWGMTPPTVNAYYSPQNNEIVFPAGILQPPFFDPSADDAVNYGAIGAVIGHEMTHGFDNQGRQFDAKGNLADWWTPQDAANFAKRAQCIIDEYDAMEPLPGVHENGKLVQGEAIADLGGITIAYKAFERTPEAKAHKIIDGYTPEQRFFLAFAQSWRENATDAFTRYIAQTNEHPVDRFRVIGTLSNMPEFRKAFGCAASDKMVRANACQIW